tara:strand:+ start:10986 stop:12368 length:1383 start_codon:yes stop_codon:yes gene_type:complete
MAVQIHKQPKRFLNPVYDDIIFTVKNPTTNVFNHKFILEVYVTTGYLPLTGQIDVKVATLKAKANTENRAHFNIANILQDFCKTDTDGFPYFGVNDSTFAGVTATTEQHSIHQIDKFAQNKNNLKRYYVKAKEEFATTQNGFVFQQGGSVTSKKRLVWNAVRQLQDGFETFVDDTLLLSGSDCFFLTGLPATVNRKIQLGQFHTIAFFNGAFGSGNENESFVSRMAVRFFDANNSAISTHIIDNTDANGGITAQTFWHASINSAWYTTHGLLYFGIGTQNLKNSGIATPTNAAYYTVVAQDSTNANVSATYRFDITGADCKGFETIRLAYLNRLGAYDYYNFEKKSTRKTNIRRSNFKQNYGTYDDANYHQASYQGGNTSYTVNAQEIIEANTDYITQDEAATLEELFTSPDVYLQEANGSFIKVLVEEKNYTKQTTANDMLIQYVIEVSKSNQTRIQKI